MSALRRTSEEAAAMRSEVIRMRRARMSHRKIAEALNVKRGLVSYLLRSLPVGEEVGEEGDDVPGCPRCHLRGPHECITSEGRFLGQSSMALAEDHAPYPSFEQRHPQKNAGQSAPRDHRWSKAARVG